MPKILDFGISKIVRDSAGPITGAGEIVGTLCYMSPEQARGHAVDARSDVFSVGVVLYECLAGRNPFVGDGVVNIETVMCALFESQPRPIEQVPAPLWHVIRRALALHANERFPTADALADALRRAAPTLSEMVLDPRPSALPGPTPQAMTVTIATTPRRIRNGVAATALCGAIAVTLASSAYTAAPGGREDVRPVPMRVATAKRVAFAIDALVSPPPADPATSHPAKLRAHGGEVALKPGF